MAKKPPKTGTSDSPKSIQNRKARHDYELLQTFEAGLALMGSEVKSIWLGRANLTDAYCVSRGDEMWIVNMDIEPYEYATHYQPERRRDRKLLLHRKEIDLIGRRSQEKGLTIVPTKVYFSHGKVKVEIALARGKKSYDKREQIAKDDVRREIERARSERN
jgi:SsrA-binding protein